MEGLETGEGESERVGKWKKLTITLYLFTFYLLPFPFFLAPSQSAPSLWQESQNSKLNPAIERICFQCRI